MEEVFYLFFPLACRWFGNRRFFVGLLLVFVALGPFGRTALAHGNETWKEYSYLGCMDGIALGCLSALIVERHTFSRRSLKVLGGAGAAFLIFNLCFSIRAYDWEFGRYGVDVTILAVAACLAIIAAAQTNWRSPRALAPFLLLGHRSYEVYLTHMFAVFGLFHLFLWASKPTRVIPVFFAAAILTSGILGELVARYYSEPVNLWLRRRWRDGPETLGSMVQAVSVSGSVGNRSGP